MTNNNLKTGMKKLNRKDTYGKDNIIKSIENIFFKCIRIGRKGMWIKPVQSGENMADGLGSGILTSIKNIIHDIEKRFLKKNMKSIKRKEIITYYENRTR
jgi:hypothetical protein